MGLHHKLFITVLALCLAPGNSQSKIPIKAWFFETDKILSLANPDIFYEIDNHQLVISPSILSVYVVKNENPTEAAVTVTVFLETMHDKKTEELRIGSFGFYPPGITGKFNMSFRSGLEFAQRHCQGNQFENCRLRLRVHLELIHKISRLPKVQLVIKPPQFE